MFDSNTRRSSLKTQCYALLLLFICIHKPAQAVLVDINFSTNLLFDTTQQVAAGGVTTGTLLTDLFGPSIGSAGSLPVTGTMTHETNPASSEQTAVGLTGAVAAYIPPITALSMNIGGTDVQANIPLINANTNSGFPIGANNGSFCIGQLACDQNPGVIKTTTSNGALLVDNAPFTIFGPNGSTTLSTRDGLSFLIGTGTSQEFTPAFTTTNTGDVFVESFSLAFTGVPGQNPFPSTALPGDTSFLTPNLIENIIIGITFNGNQLTSSFTGTSMTPVPIPAALPLFSVALIAGSLFSRRKSNHRSL